MADLTTEKILDIYKREMASQDLLELPENFYQDVAKIVSSLADTKKADPIKREMLDEELKKLVFLVREIHNTRVLKAIDRIMVGEVAAPMLERERTTFQEVRQSLERLHSELVSPAVEGKSSVSAPAERKRVPIMMRVDIDDRILGTDLKFYGPFKRGEIFSLPESNAFSMVKHDYARTIKIRV